MVYHSFSQIFTTILEKRISRPERTQTPGMSQCIHSFKVQKFGKAGQKEGIKVAGNSIVYCLTGQEEEEALYWCIANGFFFVWVAVDRFAGDLGQCGVAWVVGIEERQATGTRTRQLSEPAIACF